MNILNHEKAVEDAMDEGLKMGLQEGCKIAQSVIRHQINALDEVQRKTGVKSAMKDALLDLHKRIDDGKRAYINQLEEMISNGR